MAIEVPIIENCTKLHKKRQKGLNPKKKLMIQALKDQLGNISLACKQIGISRRTHYEWIDSDPLYKQAYEEIDEFVIDFAENALFKLIQDKNPTAIIFFLKCKAKHKGYVEKQEIEHSGSKGIKFIIEEQNDKLDESTAQTQS